MQNILSKLNTKLTTRLQKQNVGQKIPKIGQIAEDPKSKRQQSPYEFMPHLISWVVAATCGIMVASAISMIILMFNEVGDFYPYTILGVLLVFCFSLLLTFFGRHGIVQFMGTKAETQ